MWVGSEVEWCIVGVVVWVLVLGVLMLMIVDGSVSVSVSVPPPSRSPPSRARRHIPPVSGPALVTPVGLLAVAGAVQRVSAGAALIEAPAGVALLPGAMGAGGAHARGRSLEGERQDSRTRRGGGQGGRSVLRSGVHLWPLLALSRPPLQAQSLQRRARGSPGQPVGRVTLEGELELSLQGGDEAARPRKMDRDNGGVLTWRG